MTSPLTRLACPACHGPLTHQPDALPPTHGWLHCPRCVTATPVLAGFPCFGETLPAPAATVARLQQLVASQLGAAADYRHLIAQKQQRGHFDLYAAFQPFNESTRALYPLLDLLRQTLRPGDIILDTWCRTGYSAALLAALFPEQQIIALWEGNSNVLGYRGFRHWLGAERCPANLSIAFSHPDRPLPLADGSVRVVHGLDSLHRYAAGSFPAECLRVCAPDGVLVFPHIHLSNNEPDPWFERGCLQLHGRDWQQWLDQRLAGDARRGWVLAEPALFAAEDTFVLQADSETVHYNGCVLIADRRHDGQTLANDPFPGLLPTARLLENPLLTIDLDRGHVRLDEDAREGSVRYLLDRHTIYRERLHACLGTALNETEVRLLWLARQGLTVAELAAALDLPLETALQAARQLAARELVHPMPVSPAVFALQNHYGFPQRPAPAAADFACLWQAALPAYADRPMLHSLGDGSVFDGADVAALVDALRRAWVANGLSAGDTVAVQSAPHAEYLLLVWAAWLSGLTVAALDPDWPVARTDSVLAGLKPAQLWLGPEQPCPTLPAGCLGLRFDSLDEAEGTTDLPAFADRVGPFADAGPPPAAAATPETTAAILFTSGSTGDPKGVRLSQRSLCGSGTALAAHYGWQADDRLLVLASLHSMSGLRNPATAALAAGATLVIPTAQQRRIPLATLEACADITVLTTVPASLDRLCEARQREPHAPLALRQVLCTGTPLSDHSRQQARQWLGCPVANYYGLTETGGFCAGTDLNAEATDDHGIGSPVAAVMQIVDANGLPVADGSEGRLRVFSAHLMQGYRLADGSARPHHGWLDTGDIACRDADGRIHLRGRADDMLKNRHGERVSPLRIENALRALAGVADAAVIADPARQQLLAAAVVNGPLAEADLLAAVQTALGRGHCPDRLVIVPALPRNAHGKLNRQQLLDLIA